ncbi:hypothetical protein JB92DRAFT_3110642 [Gautieria morchelliformis]|nr:hypothetical protein JB92DRAFT_3110642 [Gautieria morchelliformis]
MASPGPNTTPTTLGLSTTMIAGIAVAGAAAVVLAIILTYVFVRRRRDRDTHDQESPKMLQVQVQTDSSRPYGDTQGNNTTNARLIRSVSRHNLTPSVILPLPMPLPAALPRPPKFSPEPAIHPSGRPMSSVEVVAHHQAAGTMPRPFSPGNLTQRTPTHQAKGHRMSPASASFSFSRASILSAMRPDSPSSSLRSSLSGSRLDSGVLRVRHVFAPLLPDELVLRPNEKVTLIQTFEDGWYIVGRKSPFHAPAPAKPSGYAFGQGTPADEVEIGAVPSWVFEKRTHGSPKPERPMRNVSLGVTLVDQGNIGLGGAREDVISWSNF